MRFFGKKNSENGQILLVVVLAAVITLTVGLSVATRTITNTRISTDESDSQKAFSAAEAGLEQLAKDSTLAAQGTAYTKDLGESDFSVQSVRVSGTEFVLNGGETIDEEDGIDIWLSDYPDYANAQTLKFDLYWNDPSVTNCTAVEVVVVSDGTPGDTDPTDSPEMDRYVYDNCASSRQNGFNDTNISTSSRTIDGINFNRSASIPTTGTINKGLIARVIPHYNDTKFGVVSATPLPAQGEIIESTGNAGNATRKVRVYKSWPKLPIEFFPYGIFEP